MENSYSWAAFTLIATVTLAAASEDVAWSPDAETIAELEAQIAATEFSWHGTVIPLPLERHYRYYAGYIWDGRPMVNGMLIRSNISDPSGDYIFIGKQSDFPVVFGGGCQYVHLTYDTVAAHITKIYCNGIM